MKHSMISSDAIEPKVNHVDLYGEYEGSWELFMFKVLLIVLRNWSVICVCIVTWWVLDIVRKTIHKNSDFTSLEPSIKAMSQLFDAMLRQQSASVLSFVDRFSLTENNCRNDIKTLSSIMTSFTQERARNTVNKLKCDVMSSLGVPREYHAFRTLSAVHTYAVWRYVDAHHAQGVMIEDASRVMHAISRECGGGGVSYDIDIPPQLLELMCTTMSAVPSTSPDLTWQMHVSANIRSSLARPGHDMVSSVGGSESSVTTETLDLKQIPQTSYSTSLERHIMEFCNQINKTDLAWMLCVWIMYVRPQSSIQVISLHSGGATSKGRLGSGLKCVPPIVKNTNKRDESAVVLGTEYTIEKRLEYAFEFMMEMMSSFETEQTPSFAKLSTWQQEQRFDVDGCSKEELWSVLVTFYTSNLDKYDNKSQIDIQKQAANLFKKHMFGKASASVKQDILSRLYPFRRAQSD